MLPTPHRCCPRPSIDRSRRSLVNREAMVCQQVRRRYKPFIAIQRTDVVENRSSLRCSSISEGHCRNPRISSPPFRPGRSSGIPKKAATLFLTRRRSMNSEELFDHLSGNHYYGLNRPDHLSSTSSATCLLPIVVQLPKEPGNNRQSSWLWRCHLLVPLLLRRKDRTRNDCRRSRLPEGSSSLRRAIQRFEQHRFLFLSEEKSIRQPFSYRCRGSRASCLFPKEVAGHPTDAATSWKRREYSNPSTGLYLRCATGLLHSPATEAAR